MNLSLKVTLAQRKTLFSWLDFLRKHAAEVQREEAQLVWTGEATKAAFSRETGFLTHAEFVQGEDKIVAELESVALDEPVDEFLQVDAPTSDVEPDAEAALSMMKSTWTSFRESAFQRAEQCLSSGRVVWNVSTKAEWRDVLASFHRERLTTFYGEWMSSTREWSTDYAAQIQSFMAEDPPPDAVDELREQVEAARQDLVETLSTMEQGSMDARPEVRAGRSGNLPRPELLEIEDELLPAVFGEAIATRLLEHFDEQIEDAFDS